MTDAVVTFPSEGARKKKLRQRTWKPPASARSPRPYVELHVASAFSFLEGASLPEDLVDRAASLGLSAVALLDTNGVYGAPRFYKAAKQAGIKALVGAEVVLEASLADDRGLAPVPARQNLLDPPPQVAFPPGLRDQPAPARLARPLRPRRSGCKGPNLQRHSL